MKSTCLVVLLILSVKSQILPYSEDSLDTETVVLRSWEDATEEPYEEEDTFSEEEDEYLDSLVIPTDNLEADMDWDDAQLGSGEDKFIYVGRGAGGSDSGLGESSEEKSPSPEEKCFDKAGSACRGYQADGYCERYPKVRLSFCRETCQTCTPGSEDEEFCTDKPPQVVCESFKAKGYCSTYDNVRTDLCPETCGTCSGGGEDLGNEFQLQFASCTDRYGPVCIKYKHKGYCEAIPKVRFTACRKSCGTCASEDEEESESDCMDRPPQIVCDRFKAKGFCLKYDDIKNVACRATCGTCSGGLSSALADQPDDGKCFDKAGSACSGYKEKGYCEDFYKVKHSMCRQTCGTCFADDDEDSCSDDAPQVVCDRFQDKGYCKYDDVRDSICRKTCGTCGSGEVLSMSASSEEKCFDKAGSSCGSYKMLGYCEIYYKVKHSFCRQTCGTCTPQEEEEGDDDDFCADKPKAEVCMRMKDKGYCERYADISGKICRETCGTCSSGDLGSSQNEMEPEADKCFDRAGSACVEYKAKGYCEAYHKVKHSFCRQTCGTCIPEEEEEEFCADKPKPEICMTMKGRGFCERYPDVSDRICRETCGTCISGDLGAGDLGAASDSEPGKCFDMAGSSVCQNYKKRGYCETYYKVKDLYCRQTCATCFEDEEESCADKAPQNVCDKFLEKGYCDKFDDVQNEICPATCGSCGEEEGEDLGSFGRGCFDRYGSACARYKEKGFCEKIPKVKHSSCKKTCGTCSGGPAGSCVEMPPQEVCERFKNMGMCTQSLHIRDRLCPKTCGSCENSGSESF